MIPGTMHCHSAGKELSPCETTEHRTRTGAIGNPHMKGIASEHGYPVAGRTVTITIDAHQERCPGADLFPEVRFGSTMRGEELYADGGGCDA